MNGANGNGTEAAKAMNVLNRLLAVFQYSLASYLHYARPWTHPGNARLLEVVRQIAAVHAAHARRLGGLILKRRGKIERGLFPTRFTAYNDLALDYLARRLVEHERELIEEITRSVAWLGDDPEAKQLVEDIFASERQHLHNLTELVSLSSPRSESHPVTSLAA
jgi:bacterioferritin (cytochrome b1)